MKKFNKYLYIFTFVLFFVLSINNVFATTITATVDDAEGIFVRGDASTKNTSIGYLKYGTSITLVSTTKIPSTDSNCNNWYQIYYNGSSNRYVCSALVVVDSVASVNSIGYYTTATWGYRINENYATVRKGPAISYANIENIFLGTNIKKNSCSNGWCNITYYGTKTGYVKASLISSYDEITAYDKEYYDELRNASFPESYLPFLTYLHKKYPNWIFKKITMKKTFNTVVDSEENKNALPDPPTQYKLSTTKRENPNWYTTKSSVDAVYIDPRTYLTEKNIFAFEDARYDSEFPNLQIIQSLFEGTYLAGKVDALSEGITTETYPVKEEYDAAVANITKTYIDYFMDAGIKNSVSPVHLAARAKQEGMTVATYAAVSGKSNLTYNGKSVNGYYNFYNINAFQDNYTSSSVTRGLAYSAMYTLGADNSYGKPWNTRKKAIYGGAQWIDENYVGEGQYTTYFQKFDISPSSKSSYTNQYMTNIIAPASESLSTYESRTETNIMNTAFVFSIPVFSDLPTAFTMLQPIGDTENSLSNLTLNGTTISNFDTDIVEYIQYVPSSTTSIVLAATAKSAKATITGTGTISLTNNEQEVLINVTSEVGITKTYKITIKKATSTITEATPIDELIVNVAVKFSNNYLTGIEEKTTTTSLTELINSAAPTATINITNKNNTTKSGDLATGDKVTITNGNNSKTYSIVIKGDNNGDGKVTIIDLLRVQKHILGSSILTNDYYNACDTNYDGKVTIIDLLRVQKHILGIIKIK